MTGNSPGVTFPSQPPQPKPERDLAALAKELSEVRDCAGFVACYNRHRITEDTRLRGGQEEPL